jgi:hypothetical protein
LDLSEDISDPALGFVDGTEDTSGLWDERIDNKEVGPWEDEA